jgi:putative hydrolase of the HAD superfamily
MTETRAVLLDSFGTLVSMEPPGPRLRAELARHGLEVSEERASAAFRAEIGYYLQHHGEGRDAESLEGLRDRCAERLREALELRDLDHARAREAMLASLRFSAFEDAAPVLAELRERGLRLVVASNWDCSLPEVLADAGLAPLLDAVVSSASAGAVKPDPRLFEAALDAAGCRPGEAVHVGDSAENDLAGARAAGIRAVLVDRDGDASDPEAIRSLRELPSLI